MTGHTKEPWKFQEGFANVYALSGGDVGLSIHIAKATDHQVDGGNAEADANARRIVDCVNALAGIPDPQAFREAAQKVFTLLDRTQDEGLLDADLCDDIDEALFAFRAATGETV